MSRRRFLIVDVFAEQPLRGNPVAVIVDAEGLDQEAMQRIAAWTNLSETTFCLPPTSAQADYRLRIFTPRSELPFAGHPTLGSVHALRELALLKDRASDLRTFHVQECTAGLIHIESNAAGYHFRLPKPQVQALEPAIVESLQAALGVRFERVPPRLIDVGPRWVVGRLADLHSLRRMTPDLAALATLERHIGATGVTVYAVDPDDQAQTLEVRSFAPSQGVPEDPVCGSGNGAVAIFRRDFEALPPTITYMSRQGGNLGRDGRVHVRLANDGEVWVGGRCVTTVNGFLDCE